MFKIRSLKIFFTVFIALLFTHQIAFANESDPQSVGGATNATATAGSQSDPKKPEDATGGKNVKSKFQEKFKSANDLHAYILLGGGLSDANAFSEINSLNETFVEQRKTCTDRHTWAENSCLEFLSEHMVGATSAVNSVLGLLNVSGVNDSCNTMQKAMDIAQAGLTSYTAVCGTMKVGCGSSCVAARKTLESIKKAKARVEAASCKFIPQEGNECTANIENFKGAVKNLWNEYDKDLKEDEPLSMVGKAKLCTEKYSDLVRSGIAGLASVMKSLTAAKQCEEDSRGQVAAADAIAVKCADPANEQLPECICLKKPNTPGCENGPTIRESNSSNGNIAAMGGLGDLSASDGSGSGPDFGGGGLGESMPGVEPREPASAGVGGGGGSSAGLGGGGGGGSGSGPGGEAGEGKSKLNTNILGGAGGGGGGGWGSGGFGSGSGDKYRAYLPGGDKDPNRGVAGQEAAWNKEVTGHGGKSNWDKIKDRYRDNRNTLLAN